MADPATENELCPTDNQQVLDQSTFWDSDGINWDAHRIGWVIAGSCAVVVCGALISCPWAGRTERLSRLGLGRHWSLL